MMQSFIGRTQELSTLDSLFSKGSSCFLVVKGRRRIGKSRLVEEFSKLSFHICSVTVQRLGGRILKVKKLSFHSGKAVCQ